MVDFSKNQKNYSVLVLITAFAVYTVVACGKQKSQFASGSGKIKVGSSKVMEAEQVAIPLPVSTPELVSPPDSQNSIGFSEIAEFTATPDAATTITDIAPNFKTAVAPAGVWIPTTDKGVYYINLDKERGYPVQTWPMIYSSWSGNRSYVTEIGLLLGRSNIGGNNLGGLWRVSQDDVGKAVQVLSPSDIGMRDQSRLCVTSFKDGDKKYIGAAYTSIVVVGGVTKSIKKFLKIPIDVTKTNKLDIANIQKIDVGAPVANVPEWWGYSCFIDQNRNRFWSKHAAGGKIYGVNVLTGAALNTDIEAEAPVNKKLLQPQATYADVTLNPESSPLISPPGSGTYDLLKGSCDASGACTGSYILSGIPNGSLINTPKFRASAYDPISKYSLVGAGSKLYVVHSDCFTPNTPCPIYDNVNKIPANAKYFEYTLPAGVKISTLSSLNDGRIVGISSHQLTQIVGGYETPPGVISEVYLLSLKNKQNPGDGLDIVKIASLPGNPYMYTDFTGATLYSQTASHTFDLSGKPDFKVGKTVKSVRLVWSAEGGTADAPWQGLSLKYRCYAKSGNKPEWTVAANVANAGTAFNLDGCQDKSIDAIDVQAESSGLGDVFSKTQELQIVVAQ